MEQLDDCDLFGCLREKKRDGTTITAVIDEQEHDLLLCGFHQDYIASSNPAEYELGLTYRGEVELRIHPVEPATPPE